MARARPWLMPWRPPARWSSARPHVGHLSRDLAGTRALSRRTGRLRHPLDDHRRPAVVIASPSEVGTLYGTFHFLRLLQTGRPIDALDIRERPRLARRLLNHWDNLDGSIERGYAGHSLWNWDELPARVDPRVLDYARANASLGLNGSVVNSVNANPRSFSADYLRKAAALADAFRPYGIRLYLAANFAAPRMLGELQTTDPARPGGGQVVARQGRRDLRRSSPTSAASW